MNPFTQRIIKNRLKRAASHEPGAEFCWCYKQLAGIPHGLYKSHEGCPSCKTEQRPHFRNLLTGKQAVWVYAFAGVTKQRLPKGNDTVVFKSPLEHVSFCVRRYSEPAVYGGTLYEVLHYQN